jgi:hypothetical protein
MKRTFGATVALAVLALFISSAQAVIKIEIAEVQNGFASVKGNNAEKGAQITWDGNAVTTANNNNGGFSFNGAVPADCVGEVSDGVSMINVQVLDCTPVSVAPASVPRTGQTTSYAAGDDGALQKGVAWPVPRFTDNSNGTITDNLTRLIWLKNANCPNLGRGRAQALADVASLNTNGTMNGNDCGDTSNGGSHETDWRLPNIRELFSLFDFGFQPAPTDIFTGFLTGPGQSTYWSSTANAFDPTLAWVVDFDGLILMFNCPILGLCSETFVLPVRGG